RVDGDLTEQVLHGLHEAVVDISEERLQRAQVEVLKNVRVVPLLSKTLPRVTKEAAAARMVLTTDLRELASCDFVIENVTENWEIKKQVYENLERVMPPEVCFGANTSCISITQIGIALKR